MKKCPNCGFSNSKDAKFCVKCGHHFVTANVCPNCGRKLKSGTKFCPYCGAKQIVTSNSEQPSAQDDVKQDAYGYTKRNQNTQSPQTQMLQPVLKKRITPPQCSFIDAFKLFWRNYANFSGYSSRSEFWWWFLIEEIINVIFWFSLISNSISSAMDAGGMDDPSSMIGTILSSLGIAVIWYLVILIPNLSLRTRRFRDAGISNGWIIALLIIDYVPAIVPFIGWFVCFVARIATLVIECMPSVRKVIVKNNH